MRLEELICTRLELLNDLSSYDDEPAVFYMQAASDVDEEWAKDKQFPYVVFYMNMDANAERQTSGELLVDVCSSPQNKAPELIAEQVHELLENVFFTANRRTFSAAWRKYSPFVEKDRVQGVTVVFDLYEFTNMEAGDPDPIAAINRYTACWDEDIAVIGHTILPEIYVPTREKPAAYFRRRSFETAEQTYTVVWENAELVFHLFAPALEDRLMWIEQFKQHLIMRGEVTMLDGSPMFVKDIRSNAARLPQEGQVLVNVRYGILKRPVYAHTMRHAITNKLDIDEED